MTNLTPEQQIRLCAQQCVERMECLGYKGKKREDAVLDYWCGFAMGAKAAGDQEMCSNLAAIGALIIAVRGYAEVKRLAEGPIVPPA